jgi:hypothetical protein
MPEPPVLSKADLDEAQKLKQVLERQFTAEHEKNLPASSRWVNRMSIQ